MPCCFPCQPRREYVKLGGKRRGRYPIAGGGGPRICHAEEIGRQNAGDAPLHECGAGTYRPACRRGADTLSVRLGGPHVDHSWKAAELTKVHRASRGGCGPGCREKEAEKGRRSTSVRRSTSHALGIAPGWMCGWGLKVPVRVRRRPVSREWSRAPSRLVHRMTMRSGSLRAACLVLALPIRVGSGTDATDGKRHTESSPIPLMTWRLAATVDTLSGWMDRHKAGRPFPAPVVGRPSTQNTIRICSPAHAGDVMGGRGRRPVPSGGI